MTDLKFTLNDYLPNSNRLLAIDLEWAKNWQAVEKTVPFCFNMHAIHLPTPELMCKCIESFKMESHSLFRDKHETTTEFLVRVDKLIASNALDENTLVMGHQVSSDLHTMKQHSDVELGAVSMLIERLKSRKEQQTLFPGVFDTRYDIRSRIVGQEKLRDVSLRLGVYAIQFELTKTLSMTKIYNQYVSSQDANLMERLLILNWRHAFQTTLVCLVDQFCPTLPCYSTKCKKRKLYTNDIMRKMASNKVSYVNEADYLFSITKEGVDKYLNQYLL